MPTIPLHIRKPNATQSVENPLPALLHTPTGLALLDLQGTIHFPSPSSADTATTSSSPSTLVGKLAFPLHNPSLNGPDDTKWMKRVYLYVGKNQRMSGEVKKLGKPFAVIRKVDKRDEEGEDAVMGDVDNEGLGGEGAGTEELEIVEIVRYKIVFSTRPEPVSSTGEEV